MVASLSVLNTSVTFTHCGSCSSFWVADHEGHAVEALLQFVLARIGLVVDQLVVLIVIVAVLVDFRHHGQLVGVVEIEEQLDGLLAAAHCTGSPRITAESEVRRCCPSSSRRVLW